MFDHFEADWSARVVAAVDAALAELARDAEPDAAEPFTPPSALITRVEEAAALLTAAGAVGLADRLREAADAVAEAPKRARAPLWRAALARLHLAARALAAPDILSAGADQALRREAGRPVRRAALCADAGAFRLRAGWRALCRRAAPARGGGAPLLRRETWLWAPDLRDPEHAPAGRLACVLDHAPPTAPRAPCDPLDRRAPEGWAPIHPAPAEFAGELVFYPSAAPLRAEALSCEPAATGSEPPEPPPPAPSLSFAEALAPARRALAAAPWTPCAPALLGGLRLTADGLLAADGGALPIAGIAPSALLALTEGDARLSLLATWDGARLRPLAAWSEAGTWRAPDRAPPPVRRRRPAPKAPTRLAPELRARLDDLAWTERRAVLAPPRPKPATPLPPQPRDDRPELPPALARDLRVFSAALDQLAADAAAVGERGEGRRPTEVRGMALNAAARGIAASRRRLPPTDIAYYAAAPRPPSQIFNFIWDLAERRAQPAPFDRPEPAPPPPSAALRVSGARARWLGGPPSARHAAAWRRWLETAPPAAAAAALAAPPDALPQALLSLPNAPGFWSAALQAAARFGPTAALVHALRAEPDPAARADAFERALADAPTPRRQSVAAQLFDLPLARAWCARSERLDALPAPLAVQLWRELDDAASIDRLWRLAVASPEPPPAACAARLAVRDPLLARFLRLRGDLSALSPERPSAAPSGVAVI